MDIRMLKEKREELLESLDDNQKKRLYDYERTEALYSVISQQEQCAQCQQKCQHDTPEVFSVG